MKYIALLSVVSSATAAVINIPLAGNTPAPIKLNENQIVNIRASADLSPENLKSPSIIIEVTEKDDNSPIEAKSKGITGAAKIDIVDDSFDEEERQIEIIPVDQLSPDGNNTVSRSLLDKLINFLFGDDSGDGLVPDGFSLSIGLGGKKRKARPGEIVDEVKKDQKGSKGSDDDSDSTSNQAGRPHGARPKAQEPKTGVKDTVDVPAPAPAPEAPAPPPPPPPPPAPTPEKKESDSEIKPAPKEAPKDETKPDDDNDNDNDNDDDDDDDDDDEDEEEDEEIGQFDHVEEQIVRAQVL